MSEPNILLGAVRTWRKQQSFAMMLSSQNVDPVYKSAALSVLPLPCNLQDSCRGRRALRACLREHNSRVLLKCERQHCTVM